MFRTFGTFGIWAGLMAGGITVFPMQEDSNNTFFSPVRIIVKEKEKKSLTSQFKRTEISPSSMPLIM